MAKQETRMTSSTPDALWSAPSVRLLRPAGIAWSGLRHGRLLDGCSLNVPVGTRLLVVGEPAVSGSLLLRVLAGLSRPRAGRIEIAGTMDPSADGWARRVAYVGFEPGIREWMTPRETLRLASDLLGLAPTMAARRIEEALHAARLPEATLDRPIRRGGLALAQRTAFAAALVGAPEVLLLDEPLRALDPDERRRLLRVPGDRRTVLLASRYPASEAGLVSHVALLRDGRIAGLASVRELEAAGLPLSIQGIVTLAELRAAAPDPAPGVAAGAAR
jgi:ABC-2 type transport system ATP-binding protein